MHQTLGQMRFLAHTPASHDPDLIALACEALHLALPDRGALLEYLATAPHSSALWSPRAVGTVLGEALLREPSHIYVLLDPVLTCPLIPEKMRIEFKSVRNAFRAHVPRKLYLHTLRGDRLLDPSRRWFHQMMRHLLEVLWTADAASMSRTPGSTAWAVGLVENTGAAVWRGPGGRVSAYIWGRDHLLLGIFFQSGTWDFEIGESVDVTQPPTLLKNAVRASSYLFAEMMLATKGEQEQVLAHTLFKEEPGEAWLPAASPWFA